MVRPGLTAGLRFCAGKYTETNLPKGPRGAVINADRVREVQPLLSLMRDIASAHGGKTPGQVGAGAYDLGLPCPEHLLGPPLISDRAAGASAGLPWP